MRSAELTDTIDLPEMSLRLGISRERALRLVLTGGVRGQRDDRGRWRVVAQDVQALQEKANPEAGK